ncbi:serine hydrolase domain-containing protein [Ramlibacter tataouinensis]|uniref:Candidate lipase/esterase (Tributyrin hydrolysis, LR1) n=1 Tax=Ramlibacter tataouinensis (strain ATCC BAA-407 / DSM 14655 / LMG 21543 / TTB310) TaxID=365046 RepID=F5Y1G9_RAMTT|nr:serine hydrolase domain-containing protein [Ramlibacter tataouinensis]AEG94753.1 Candidate lipase/esterase (tributyrin hydrolysis, LR1) [Ramlibacter tataouinensis TTB310]
MEAAATFDALRTALQARIDAGRMPGAVAWVQHRGRTALCEALGRQGPGSGAPPMACDSIFRIYSMTKPVVSLAALMLVEQGRLLLGEPVSRWLPAFAGQRVLGADGRLAPVAREATVHDLLRHTAGLSYGWEPGALQEAYQGARIGSRGLSNAQLAQALGPLPLAHQPGTAWEYSRATDVLGALLEQVAGRPLGELLREAVFGPLGLRDTGFCVPEADHGRIAEPFAPRAGDALALRLNDVRQPVPFESGGGGLVSTAADYARFLSLLLAGGTLDGVRLAGRKTIAWMTADHLGAIPVAGSVLPAGHGFGLGVAVRRGVGLAARAGSPGTYGWSGIGGTMFFVDPSEQLFAIVLVQAPSELDTLVDLVPNTVFGAL